MRSITAKQHSKVLGFALIAYGLQFLFGAFNALGEFFNFLRFSGDHSPTAYMLFPFDSTLYRFWLFTISIVSGIAIRSSKRKDKFLALLFVFLAFALFPLGTILSFYVLFYLFVISENKTEKLTEESK